MRRVFLAWVVLAAGCASAPIKKSTQADLTRADALVLEGCYDCLNDARVIYERAAIGKARVLVLPRLFETALLITLRERELAIDTAASLARAGGIAAELAPALEADRYLALVDAVPPDAKGVPRRDQQSFRVAHGVTIRKLEGELAWLETGALAQPVRQYLALAVTCAYPSRLSGREGTPPAGPVSLDAPPPRTGAPAARTAQIVVTPPVTNIGVPLIAYRTAICRKDSAPLLTRLREVVPRFVEASFFIGRLALDTVKDDGGPAARERLTEAYDRFPNASAVTYAMGQLYQLAGESSVALKYYDETLAMHPLHEDALIGRTICLVFTKQMAEAIREATHMIEVDTDNVVHADHWRAWVRHYQQELTDARADIEQAKKRTYEASVFTLAGIIEHDQNDLGPAQKDLLFARNVDGNSDCTPSWYLGSVLLKLGKWTESASHFEGAMYCYEAHVHDGERSLAMIVAKTDLEPVFRARQIQSFETAIANDRSQYYAAAFNAAARFAQALQKDKALPLLDIAAKDPEFRERVEELRKYIKGGGFTTAISSIEYGDVHPRPFRHDARKIHD